MRYIGIGTTHITSQARAYIRDVLKTQRLSYGPYSEKFEQLFLHLHQRRFAVVSNSGTSSLQVALHALKELHGWNDGDEVLVPAITFVASVNVILQNNLIPCFVDVHPTYYDMDPDVIEQSITPRTRAIMVVHVFGQPADMTRISQIAKKHKIIIIEDSCETMFARHAGKPVGSWGEVACFSTYAAHLITTGVGGIAVTNNKKLALYMKSLCNHGRDNLYISIDDDNNIRNTKFSFILESRFRFRHIGYSYRITELEAALGLAQLEKYTDIITPRQRNAAYLSKHLARYKQFLQLPHIRSRSDHVFMVYPLMVIDARISRNELVLFLERRGIETRPMLPLINQPVYRFLTINQEKFPVSQTINSRGFYIGCHQKLKEIDLRYIIKAFHDYFKEKKLS